MISNLPLESKKGVTGSLARRVLFICLGLIIIPLLIQTVLLWEKEWRLKMRDLFTELQLLDKGFGQVTEQWIELESKRLKLIDPEDLKTAGDESETLFILSREGKCIASNRADLVGIFLFAVPTPKQVFIDPTLSLCLVQPKGENFIGLATDASLWLGRLAHFQQGLYPFDLSLISSQGQSLASTDPNFSLSSVEILEKQPSIKLFQSPGHSYAVRAFIPEADFSILVSIPHAAMREVEGAGLFESFGYFLLLLLIAGGISAYLLTQRMARPLKQLHTVMDRVQEGDLQSNYQNDRLGFEINELGTHFNQTLRTLLNEMQATQNERVAKEILAEELKIGHEIQKNLLPKELPTYPELEMASGFLAAREVAGDFYDLFVKENGQLMLAVADVSDKGISACLYSFLLRSLLRSQISSEDDLGKALMRVNDLFSLDVEKASDFATAWVGLFDLKTHQLTFCCAGHPPALLIRANGKIEELGDHTLALGIEKWVNPPKLQTIVVESGDLLLLYSDGLIEAQNEEGRCFGKKALVGLIQEMQIKTPKELVDRIFQAIQQFSQGVKPNDDLTVLAIKLKI